MSDHIVGGTPQGRRDSLVDASDAVLLGDVEVVLVDTLAASGAGRAIGLDLGGRVNHSTELRSQLYLMDVAGAAVLVAEILGLAHRAGADLGADWGAALDAAIAKAVGDSRA